MTILSPGAPLPLIDISPPSVDDEIQTYSAGEIITYIKCPYFYRLREIWRYKPGLAEALGYGKSLHHCLRYASELVDTGMRPKEAIIKAVDERFHVPYAGGKIRENMKKKAEEILTRFVERYEMDMGKVKEVEARLEFPVQKATITGRVDVILKDENTVEIRDYKTSDEVTTFEQASVQIRLYALGLQMLGMPVDYATIAYLENADIKSVNIEKRYLHTVKEIAEKSIGDIISGRFNPKPGDYCTHCDQRKICASG